MNEAISYTAAAIVGLLGGVHCIGMCGGIINALSINTDNTKGSALSVIFLYNTGRIFSYSVAGALVGGLGGWLLSNMSVVGPVLRVIAGTMLVAMGLYIAGWWRGLMYVEKLGGYIWRWVQPFGNKLMPVTSSTQAILLGILWGWIPCGLVYSTLTLAAASANWQQSAIIMACFGVGTMPIMLISGVLSQQLKTYMQKTSLRNSAAILIIAFGIWTIILPATHLIRPHDHSSSHSQHSQPGRSDNHEHSNH